MRSVDLGIGVGEPRLTYCMIIMTLLRGVRIWWLGRENINSDLRISVGIFRSLRRTGKMGTNVLLLLYYLNNISCLILFVLLIQFHY